MRPIHIFALLVPLAIVGYFFLSSDEPDSRSKGETGAELETSDKESAVFPTRAKGVESGDSSSNTGSPEQGTSTAPAEQAPLVTATPSNIPTAFALKPDQRIFLDPNVPEAKRQPLAAAAGDRNTTPKYFYELSVSQFSIVDDERMLARLRVFDKDGNSVEAKTARPRVLAAGSDPQLAGIALSESQEGNDIVIAVSGHELGLAPGMHRLAIDVDIGEQMALASAPFFYTPGSDVPGRFTGRSQHQTTDAGLMAAVEIEVVEAGEFIIDANLMGTSDAPIARATFRGQVAAGFHSVPLTFPTELIKASSNAGPFALHQVRGYKVRQDQVPNRVMMPDAPMLVLDE